MACGTILIAFVPAYAAIGVLAPLLVVTGRLLQGFSAGVELGGVSVYLSEMATPGHKGFYVSWQSASQQVAVVFAALLGFAIAKLMPPQAAADWGWRIPFVIGCAIVLFLYMIRRSLEETEAFAARKVHPTTAQIYETLAANWALVLGGVAMVVTTTVSFPLITVYTPTFGAGSATQRFRRAARDHGDRGVEFPLAAGFGRALRPHRPQADFVAFTLLALLTAYPALAWLVREPSFMRMLAVELWLSLIYAWYNGAMLVALTEVVPATVRTAGFSLAYSLATTLGGSSLAISTWFIERTGDRAAPGYWMSFPRSAARCHAGALSRTGRGFDTADI